MWVVIGGLSLAIWLALLLARGGFWRFREVLERNGPAEGEHAAVAVVIPARDEAPVIERAVRSLLDSQRSGPLRVYVVDDHSSDGTAEAARGAGVMVIRSQPLPEGWTGKLWAVAQGVDAALAGQPDFVLLTDADIVHAPGNLARLVARAQRDGVDMASVMVRLHCRTAAERLTIPAFVFFFFKLYPPAWIASARSGVAGAAGGCILIRPEALKRIGGMEAIRGELIDDCALAQRVKSSGGRIWLGLSRDTVSIRLYAGFGEVREMIARTAFTQLRHSGFLLAGTLLGMALIYLAPPLLLFAPDWRARVAGGAAWLIMSAVYVPALRFYKQPVLMAPLLPLTAAFYSVATLESAVHYWRGSGGRWKGRSQAVRSERAG